MGRPKCVVAGSVGLALVISGLLPLALPSGGRCGAVEVRQKLLVWVAPDSTWRMIGFRWFDREFLARHVERRPEKVVGGLMYEQIAKEEGEWFLIRVDLVKVEKVTITKNTRVVVTNKEGEKIESEAICCWPDQLQTRVYDSRSMPVVVTKRSLWCGVDGRGPFGSVKFPAGSISVEDIVSFEVVGAVEDRGGREVK